MSKTKTEKTEREAFKKGKTGLDATLIDRWIAEHYEGPEDLLGQQGLLAQLTKAVVEQALGAELTHRLGYAPGGAPAAKGGNLDALKAAVNSVGGACKTCHDAFRKDF